jgi:hypothetical protein
MEYSHNLKIILTENNNIIEDKDVLETIKSILSTKKTHQIEWNGRVVDITIKWDKKELNTINQSLMGDLFSCPIYEFDTIILRHTQETISKINCKYLIKFYLSRTICDKKINKDSAGFVI